MMNTSTEDAVRTVAELGPYLAVENAVICELKLLLEEDYKPLHAFASWFSLLYKSPKQTSVRARILNSPPNWQLVDTSLVSEICKQYRERHSTC